MLVDITTWYLEMRDRSELRPKYSDDPSLTVLQAEVPCPELNRFLYASVGGHWYWCDRLPWSYNQWWAYVNRLELQTWVAYYAGTPTGYIELETQPDASVKIAYFGLIRQFIGQGIGGHLLSTGIQQAWDIGANRVWVHTCSLDSPSALKNYQARGLKIYREEQCTRELPKVPPGPWPGAHPPTFYTDGLQVNGLKNSAPSGTI